MLVRRRVVIAGLIGAPILAEPPYGHAAPSSFAPIVARVAPTVVGVSVLEYAAGGRLPRPLPPGVPGSGSPDAGGSRPPHRGTPARAAGSGFIIDPGGIIVTNNHVVGNAERIMVTLDNGRRLPAELAGTDQLTDLAIVRVKPGRRLRPARWGDSARVRVGDWILAAGNPFDLGPSFTAGIVSARGRVIGDGPFDHFLQLDAPINPGNSGGPSFDMNGRVIGVNTAIVSPTGGSVGIGFAIPSNTARPVIEALIAHGSIARGWLGVALADPPDGRDGVVITGVEENGPAASAGLEPGDLVRAVDGVAVADANAMIRAIASVRPGSVERLSIVRDGRTERIGVRVGRRPAELGND